MASFKEKARALKNQVYVVYLAARHPDTPWYVKLMAGVIVAYALSPVDLIPDFIPVLGLVDELILIPLGIALLLRLTPPHVLEQCRAQAAGMKRRVSYVAGAVILMIWLGVVALCIYLLLPWFDAA